MLSHYLPQGSPVQRHYSNAPPNILHYPKQALTHIFGIVTGVLQLLYILPSTTATDLEQESMRCTYGTSHRCTHRLSFPGQFFY